MRRHLEFVTTFWEQARDFREFLSERNVVFEHTASPLARGRKKIKRHRFKIPVPGMDRPRALSSILGLASAAEFHYCGYVRAFDGRVLRQRVNIDTGERG